MKWKPGQMVLVSAGISHEKVAPFHAILAPSLTNPIELAYGLNSNNSEAIAYVSADCPVQRHFDTQPNGILKPIKSPKVPDLNSKFMSLQFPYTTLVNLSYCKEIL